MYIISSCLLGENCRYNGGNFETDAVKKLIEGHSYLSVCPEVAGGFSTPRPPVELLSGRAIRPDGEDVTAGFIRGAEAVWEEIQSKIQESGETIELAVLKARSPSCGAEMIYDGTFSGKRVPGDGVLTAFLKEKGIKVISEEDLI